MAGPIFVIAVLCWSLISVSSQDQNTSQNGTTTHKDAKILILGAGMTGITAAKTLHDKGYRNLIILEGSNRIGGRIKETKIGNFIVEGGAAWIHGSGTNPLFTLAKRFNLSYVTTHYENYSVRDGSGRDVTDEYAFRYNKSFGPAFKFFKSYTKESRARGKTDFTIRSALLMGGWRPRSAVDDLIEFFNIDFSYAYAADVISGLHAYIYDAYEAFNTTDDLTVNDVRGYSHIVRSLHAEFISDGDQRLHLNEVVTDIDQTDGGIVVRTKDNVTYSADYVIVTFSIGVLQHNDVRFSPPLPYWKREAVNQFQQALLMHIYVQFAEKFWDDHEFLLYASERRNHYNIWHNIDKSLPGSRILQVSVVGDEVKRLERMKDTEIISELMSVLRTMYSGCDISEPIAYNIPRWYSDPLFRGAFSNWPPGYTLNTFSNLQAPVGKIFFAGEYTDHLNYGYIQASYLSALRVVENIDECIRKPGACDVTIRPKDNEHECTYHARQMYSAKSKEDYGSCSFNKCPVSSSSSYHSPEFDLFISKLVIAVILRLF
ncbi:hypothetical protein CHS0354_034258 [Potamilus streckersoni]|uniref:Amine oxidase n=1 Tax=Potamilus streckersoni TaxID=2493646 RepID=A0AAE0S4A5_9BIVA|nr:hypothetical protein CHS0354_034258 [Potamilus streckersoni]